MAKLSKWAIFMRAFLVTLIVGQPAQVGSQSAGEEVDWQRALNENTATGFYRYLSEHPSGRYTSEALRQLRTLGVLNNTEPGRQIPSLGGGRSRGFEPADADEPSYGNGGLY